MFRLSQDHVYEVIEETIVVALRRPPTLAALGAVQSRVQSHVRSQGTKLAYMHVVLDVPTTGRVDDDIRAAFVSTARRVLPHLDGCAMVLIGDGFKAAAMRAAVSAGLIALRPAAPVRIVSNVDDGAQWLSRLPVPTRRDPERLSDAARALSEELLSDYLPTG